MLQVGIVIRYALVDFPCGLLTGTTIFFLQQADENVIITSLVSPLFSLLRDH